MAVLLAVPLAFMLLLSVFGHSEMSLYPGLRRKTLQQNFDEPADFLAQLMEENARRRLQQQFEQQLELINMQMNRQRQKEEQRERYRQQLQALAEANNNIEGDIDETSNNNNQYDIYEQRNRDFSYKLPNINMNDDKMLQRIAFAVGPADPRFYEEEKLDDEEINDVEAAETIDSQPLNEDEYEEYVPAQTKTNELQSGGAAATAKAADAKLLNAPVLAPAPAASPLDTSGGAANNFHKIKPNTVAAAAVAGVNVASMKPASGVVASSGIRHDINALIDKLQKEGQSSAIVSSQSHDVVREHMGMKGDLGGVYIVSLIAGVSAAVTVGLIAMGFVWYMLHSRNKAAADVEYPAYGVTGPNKDISPSGDRKLAQSAQMYHYQHQKQQIIAMENRQAVEGSCGLSDVDSDDDNEEGDYTVYECPGLAPTGEMEVKNPLFLDETPVTPSSSNVTGSTATTANTVTNITQATPQQPQLNKKNVGKANISSSVNMSSDEKQKKKQKK